MIHSFSFRFILKVKLYHLSLSVILQCMYRKISCANCMIQRMALFTHCEW